MIIILILVEPITSKFIHEFNDQSIDFPKNIFDTITFEIEMTNLSDTFSRFILSSLYQELIVEEEIILK
jgi:hypothetical protein